jgi:hypothetical protein
MSSAVNRSLAPKLLAFEGNFNLEPGRLLLTVRLVDRCGVYTSCLYARRWAPMAHCSV